jgi:hypothetical protein
MEMTSARFIANPSLAMRDATRPSRHAVAAHARVRVRGVEPQAAYERTIAFYRSSGLDWARMLGI